MATVKLSIEVDEEKLERLRKDKAERGISMTFAIDRGLELYFKAQARRGRRGKDNGGEAASRASR